MILAQYTTGAGLAGPGTIPGHQSISVSADESHITSTTFRNQPRMLMVMHGDDWSQGETRRKYGLSSNSSGRTRRVRHRKPKGVRVQYQYGLPLEKRYINLLETQLTPSNLIVCLQRNKFGWVSYLIPAIFCSNLSSLTAELSEQSPAPLLGLEIVCCTSF